jgi:crotonobetainyl-CoA:carnitine CoA-transferase CaiB-like acyl-CoA transferase
VTAFRDLTIVDLTIARSGPVAVRQFADWGASVIHVDSPSGNDLVSPLSSDYINLHRNQRALHLDLKRTRGREIFDLLVDRADVLVENFRPTVKSALGIDYATLSRRNPRLVYGSISGFGQNGPYSVKGGVDQIVQGMGGLMSVTGHPGGGPLRTGTAIADLATGQHLAFGILAALYERERSGLGQWVQASLLESMIATMDFQAARWLIDGEIPGPVGNDHPNNVPMSAYPTSDGFINIGASSPRLYRRLCQVLDDDQLKNDERFATPESRLANRDAINARISELTRTQSANHWWRLLDEAGVPAGPIYNVAEVFSDPQVQYLHMTETVEHAVRGPVELIRQPVTLSRTPASIETAAPSPGQHRDEILTELGLSPAEIAELVEAGIV